MKRKEDWVRERRAARRYRAVRAARPRFVTGIGGGATDAGDEPWPGRICRTCDVSEAGLGLVVPAVREGDD